MKLFNKSVFTLCAVMAILGAGCSDDVVGPDSGRNPDEKGVVVYVPKIPEGNATQTGTRAPGTVSDWNSDEVRLSSLRLIAYPVKNGVAGNPISVDLTDPDECSKIVSGYPEGYDAFTFNLENGEYRMYVVANTDVTGSESEVQLKAKTATVPADVKASGLPMSCAHKDLKVMQSGSESFGSINDGQTISVSSTGGGATYVRADLRFVVAKVRVTLLNDMRPKDLVSDVVMSGHKSNSILFPDNGYNAAEASGFTPESAYYTMPVKSADGLVKSNVDGLTGKAASPDTSKEWAWQTTFYIPERLVNTGNNCSLDMKIGGASHSIKIGHDESGKRVVERSHFYDYVGTPDGKFSLYVEEWTPMTIAGALYGPSFLHVDQTRVGIEAGSKTSIWFDSNRSVDWESQQFEGQDIYMFEFNRAENPDSIRVWLNPQISGEEYKRLKLQPALWNSFMLKAGSIIKKIEVNPLVYKEFIDVDPEVITIDVAEKKTSGDYSNYIPVSITTNLRQVTVKKVGWLTDAVSSSSLYLNRLDGENETQIASGNSQTLIDVPESGEVKLRLRYSGLNTARAIWQEDRDLVITIEGTDADGKTVRKSVRVYIRSANDVYRIHFKAPGWHHPHIYVYQCLQLPSDHSTHPNAPVGADRYKAGNTAALEYSFTGALAFKGWNVGEYNNPNAPGAIGGNYFYYFNDASDGSWEPGSAGNIAHYYTMDFCAAHRQELKGAASTCPLCTGVNYAMSWPGIHMKKDPNPPANDPNDWWYFELTGVATPGKALIMFAECLPNTHNPVVDHEADINGTHYTFYVRYPDDSDYTGGIQPGIPLFDFPAKEGWFVYNGRNKSGDHKLIPSTFTSTPPDASQSNIFTYRIYWPYSTASATSWMGLNVWMGNTVWGNKIYDKYPNVQSESGFKYGKYNDQYAYLEFKVEDSRLTGTCRYQRMIKQNSYDENNKPALSFDNFTLDSDGNYSYTITAVNNGHSGKP